MTEAMEEPDLQDMVTQSAMDTLDCFETWLDHRKQSHLANSMRTNSMRWNSQLEFESFCTERLGEIDKVA